MSRSTARFTGHVVLVTAAGQGMGEAIAQRFASEGGQVLVTDRDPDKAEAVAKRIRDGGGLARSQPCDVADSAAVGTAVQAAIEHFGGLDVLINNAARSLAGTRLDAITDEEWSADLDITLTGAFRCTRAAMPHLVAAGRGAVVNIGSVNSERFFGDHAYSAAKAGLVSFTRTVAAQSAAQGVRVNMVMPGTTRTPVWDRPGGAQLLDQLAHQYPLGRVGEPQDIAAACAFLASSDASWITGVALPVEGGVLTINSDVARFFGTEPAK